jgi:TRAP-type C4-dicarboxylate transport system permease small subunit
MAAKALDVLRLIERGAVIGLFAIMVFLFFVNISVRTVLPEYSSTITWAEEAARLAMIWGIFLIAGITLEQGRHIAMTSVTVKMPETVRLAVRRLIGVAGAVFFAYFFYLSANMTMFVFRTGQVFPDLGISSGYLYLGPTVGFALIGLRYIIEIFSPADPATAAPDQL